ncbi:GNAT family N-acetyltransferase [uncultured Parasphingorhabdus sp.]|uniref:GNAT family N-acetyltransferase n=1 Tax=uncultured Parasphingorhabdus sp. TaxID=2709694 RepID=UPI0030D93168
MLKASDIEPAQGIETVGRESVPALAAITADAFRDDPFNSWLFGGFDPMQRTFANLARHIYTPNGFCQILNEDGEGRAAAMWLMPGDKADATLGGTLQTYWGLFASGGLGALQRGKAAGDAMAKHHITEPHAYLFTVGVAGAGRGRGLGRRLVEPVLQACDRSGTTAYLENSNPANRRFYASLGFERVELFHARPDSPPLEAMQRLPR